MQQMNNLLLILASRLQHLRWFGPVQLLARHRGQGLVEYGLILTLITVVVVGIMTLLGQTVSGLWYQRIVDGLNDAMS
jgi:pilus assembly protein Flp/PilA